VKLTAPYQSVRGVAQAARPPARLPLASTPDVPALRSGVRRSSFCRVVLQSVGDTRSLTQGALTSIATPSHRSLRRTLRAAEKPIR